MQNRQLGSGFGIVDVKFLTKMPTKAELENYGPNEYLLIKENDELRLIYIDVESNEIDVAIDEVPGLKNALARLPQLSIDELQEEERSEVLGRIQAHHLKTHGGNEFLLFRDEKYRGLINDFPKDKMELINNWINSNDQENKDITSILDKDTLARVMPDVLVNLEVTRLIKILPKIIASLSEEIKASFSDEILLKKLDRRFVGSLKKSLRNDMPSKLDAKSLSLFLAKDNLVKIRPELMAYLIPAILDLMEDKELEAASVAIAKQLDKKDYRMISNEKYFNLDLETVEDEVTVKNNHRTLAFYSSNSLSTAFFKNKKWNLNNTHIHPEDEGQEPEYRIYESRKQLEEVRKGITRDPNLDTLAEVHTVYSRVSKRGNLKYMAIGFVFVKGKENENFNKLLNQVANLDQITDDMKLNLLINYQQFFMPTLQQAQQRNSIFFHSWGSLKSPTYGFKAGLQFNVVPDTIEISQNQYNRFKQLFGEMSVLTDDKVLEPIDRKADHRQPRP
ncbi:MAG: carbonic anhydrase family protein [Gammaproteobacteria bacterium]|nr:carbonic anhydrase family protein [Gammaproteobacteria bacterium]